MFAEVDINMPHLSCDVHTALSMHHHPSGVMTPLLLMRAAMAHASCIMGPALHIMHHVSESADLYGVMHHAFCIIYHVSASADICRAM